MEYENEKQGELRLVAIYPEGPTWHDEARQDLRENGAWSRMLACGAVTSSTDPSVWVPLT